jgi:hypothetical protein
MNVAIGFMGFLESLVFSNFFEDWRRPPNKGGVINDDGFRSGK